MKVTNIHVDGFGVWTDLTLDHLSHEVTVFYGPNEAGKTTLMQLVRAVLYGYSPERRQRYLPPVFGGRPGGSLVAQGSRGRFVIDRRADPSDSSGLGKVSIKGDDGTLQGQHLLSVMLAGVDEPIFNNVFAVGLREIQELGTLTGTQAASHLFALTAGMDRVSLVDVMHQLTTRREQIVGADGGGQLPELLARREKLSAEIDQLQATTQQWSQLVGQQATLESGTREAEEEVAALQHRLQVVELADRIRDRWLEQEEVNAEVERLEPLPALPEGALARYEELAEQIAQQHSACAELKGQWLKLRDEARSLPINEPLSRNCCRVEALAEQEGWLTSIGEHITWLHSEVASLETELTTERQELGLGDTFDWDELPHLRERAEEDLREIARQMKHAQDEVENTRERVANQRQEAKRVAARFDSALAELDQEDLPAALETAGEQVSMLRRRIQIDERMDQLKRHRAELEEEGDELAEEQVLSTGALAGVGLLFVLGIVLVLTGATGYYFGLSSTGAWLTGIIGFATLLGSIILKVTLERMAAARLDDCDDELERVVKQMRKAKREREELDGQLPPGSGTLATRLQKAEQQLTQLEQLVPLDAERLEAREQDQLAQDHARQAAAHLKSIRNQWREALLEAGLPETLTPAQIKRLISRCDYICQLQERLEQRRGELEKRNAESVALTSRINRLSDDVGIKARSREPIELLHAVLQEHSQQQELLKQRDALKEQARQIRSEHAKQTRLGRKLARAQREVLHEANVAGDEELRELAEQVGRHAEFSARGAQLEEEIAAIIGDVEFDEIDAELQAGDATQLEARFDALSSQLGEAEGRLKELYQQRGRLAEQTKALESDPRLPTAVMERNGIDEQLRQIAHEWQVLAGTSAILESVRHIYETQRQPATLSDASRYLERMTDGRYKRVWTPLDEDTLLVDDAHGHSLGIEVLSAGTREQVFLAIRLALVSMYARRGAALPLVLDDVLVNCDAVRARAAAKVLCDFANEGHQLLIFTCHEHIVQIFRQLHADVRRLPLRAELGDLAEPPVSDEAEHLVLDAPAPLTDEDVDDDFDDELVEEKEPGALIDEAETDVEDEPLHEDEEPEFESPNLDDSAEQLEDAHPPVSPPAFAWASPSGENAWIEESPAPVDDDEPFAELLQQASPPSAWHAQQVPWEEG